MVITSFDYTQIINNLCPDSIFTINENDYSTLIWSSTNTHSKPTEDDIIAKNIEMKRVFMLDHLRMKRDELLRDSDKFSLIDFPHPNETVRNNWLIYRLELRDITNQDPEIDLETGELTGVNWPTPPS